MSRPIPMASACREKRGLYAKTVAKDKRLEARSSLPAVLSAAEVQESYHELLQLQARCGL